MDYPSIILYLLQGTGKAIQVFALTLLFSVPLGMIVAQLRMMKNPVIQLPVRLYLLVMRGTPLLLQLVFFMYFPPFVLGISIDRFFAAILTFSLNYAAYFAEIFRGGIESIPVGQNEAAQVLGFSRWKTFRLIILPQVIKRILPASANECMTLVKDTALAQVIGVAELFRASNNVMSREFSVIPIVIAGLFYLAMNGVVASVFSRAEKKMSYYRS